MRQPSLGIDNSDTLSTAQSVRNSWFEKESQYQENSLQPDFSVFLLASFTIQPLVAYLGGFLAQYGFNPSFHIAPYNQIIQTCLSYPASIPAETKSIVIAWRIEDLLLTELDQYVQSRVDFCNFKELSKKLSMLTEAISRLNSDKHFIIFCMPAFPCVPYFSLYDAEVRSSINEFYLYIVQYFIDYLKKNENINWIDLGLIQRTHGMNNSLDLRTWYLFKQPWQNYFLLLVGQEIAETIRSITTPSAKCIALDCDGVLWGGTIGEDGITGISLGDHYPGCIFKDVQKYLLELRKKGVLLALLSKNNENDVWEVFEKHEEMVLKREHISAYSINWNSKYKGLSHIATALNIGIDSIVFIDDSKFEIAEMANYHSNVHRLCVPDDLMYYLSMLQKFPYFRLGKLTKEDYGRAEMVKNEEKRKQLKSNLSQEEFIKSLRLTIDLQLAEKIHIERIVQLLGKTNQFNLTTRRHNLSDVNTMLNNINCRIFVLFVKDIFGDYGLTGVAIGFIEGDIFEFDSFLVSCRVLNRSVEDAFLIAIMSYLKQEKIKMCLAKFIPTEKNLPAANFLSSHKFEVKDDGFWTYILNDMPKTIPHLTVRLNIV